MQFDVGTETINENICCTLYEGKAIFVQEKLNFLVGKCLDTF